MISGSRSKSDLDTDCHLVGLESLWPSHSSDCPFPDPSQQRIARGSSSFLENPSPERLGIILKEALEMMLVRFLISELAL